MSFFETETEQKVIIEIDTDLLEGAEEEAFTLLHCKYITSPKFQCGWWVNIYKTSYLKHMASNETLEMLHAIGIPYAPEKHYLQKFGDSLSFTLVFPKIPKHWDYFNFIEICNGEDGLSINNIKRNNSGIYRVKIA